MAVLTVLLTGLRVVILVPEEGSRGAEKTRKKVPEGVLKPV